MRVFRGERWSIAAAGLTLLYAAVSLLAPRGLALTAFADGFWVFAVLGTALIFANNAISRAREERWFWSLMAFGFLMWSFNQVVWAYREVLLHGRMPDPYFADIVLFLHVVPLIAAAASRPDQVKNTPAPLRTLNFLMLLGWWIFLYAFVVFPYQYIALDIHAYNRYYDRLYQIEDLVLVLMLAYAAWTSSDGWRRLYLQFMTATALYVLGSLLLQDAVESGKYYSGSVYDVALVSPICWMGALAYSARNWDLQRTPALGGWKATKIVPHLAMLAILSLPPLALWTILADHSPRPSKVFRMFSVLTAMLVLGAFAFLRQYLQDQELVRLLSDSRKAYEAELRLQSNLVQKEKLASLGNLVAGAAHEIKEPPSSILTCSEDLHQSAALGEQQSSLVKKIATQAARTRDLVSDLLSFAQQSPGEKVLLDLAPILQRSAHMMDTPKREQNVHITVDIEPDLPQVRGNAQQLLQAFIEIIENSKQALEERTGGALDISARASRNEVVVQFSDNGPGLKDPQRVFDPFYTTKPIGKGTGLGLSVVYGIVQDHAGQISCQNNAEGGAVFVIKVPAGVQTAAHAAAAAAQAT